ncbi:3-oxoadipate enol-lactonase [Mangrovicoccus algicola]|uniref:3-oxoadipate enol-lactonase n=1 Tax=Mangrovicoccus algicola TaxID=2771008 RepID=A0A8J6YVA4_9RHOB|nr:3-oxoadipate enol-lactonase [Mangrovicoccus algicola]MBE3638287.1 3-oxoadipate enol-lactonase [Mangrovicoccus algicola]
MQFITANDITLHVRVAGPKAAAQTLVLVNSLGTDFRIWDEVLAHLAGRAPDLRVICYDKRGHGLSDAGESITMADHVADLAGLLDLLGTGPAVVLGLSVGGQVALGLSAARPELVAGLILSNTAHRIGTPQMWQTRIRTIEDEGIEALATPILERWFSAGFREGFPTVVAGYRNMLIRTPLAGYLGTCAAIRDTDLTLAAESVTVPTLCIAGEEDGSTPPELVAGMAALIPGAVTEIIAKAGHLPGIEFPDEVAQLIARHLDRIKETP